MKIKDIPLPGNWPALVCRAMIHAASLAHFNIISSWGQAADADSQNARLKVENDRLQTELSRKDNQLRIISARLERVPVKKRPYYLPEERMNILNHKAACGWNLRQTAEAFLTDQSTIFAWMQRVDDNSLIKIPQPWNKYPEYLKYTVRQLKVLVPRLGKKKIAEYFTRSGLYLAATSVGRYLKSEQPIEPDSAESEASAKSGIKSLHPNHTWTVDLTTVPTSGGFWASWLPNSLLQRWPFCWWVAVIVDHFSRRSIGFALFRKQPSSEDVTAALDKAAERAGKFPKHIISDKGIQFDCANYKDWCSRSNVKPRFGAIGKHGSIAVTERFIKSLKEECTKRIIVPMNDNDMRCELALYCSWYNLYWPHEYLGGRTPEEVYNHSPPNEYLKLISGSEVPKMELQLSFLEGREHLPVIELKKVA